MKFWSGLLFVVVFLLASACNSNSGGGSGYGGGGGLSAEQSAQRSKLVDQAGIHENELKKLGITYSSTTKLEWNGERLEYKLEYPKEHSSPKEAIEKFKQFVANADAALAIQSEPHLKLKAELAHKVLREFEDKYTDEYVAQKEREREEARIAQEKQKKEEERLAKLTQERLKEIKSLEGELDELGLAFKVTTTASSTEVVISSMPQVARQEVTFGKLLGVTDTYYRKLGELLRDSKTMDEKEKIGFSLKQQLTFTTGMEWLKRIHEGSLKLTSNEIAEKLGLKRKVGKAFEVGIWDLDHFKMNGLADTNEEKKGLETLIATYKKLQAYYPLKDLFSKDGTTELERDRNDFRLLLRPDDRKVTWTSKNPEFINGEFTKSLADAQAHFESMLDILNKNADKDAVYAVLSEQNISSLKKVLSGQYGYLQEFGWKMKVDAEKVVWDEDFLREYMVKNRFKKDRTDPRSKVLAVMESLTILETLIDQYSKAPKKEEIVVAARLAVQEHELLKNKGLEIVPESDQLFREAIKRSTPDTSWLKE